MKRLMFLVFTLALVGAASAGEWHIETVDGSEGYVCKYTSLALDSTEYPHISYFDRTNYDLKYARWDGSTWRIEIVDTDLGISGGYTSLELDSSDYPRISYYGNWDLKYAYWNGSTWQIETVDSEGEVGGFTSLALDGSGYPRFSYYDWSDENLKYARWNGSDWQIETVDSDGDVGPYTSLALDSSGYPHISYLDGSNICLKYARWDGEDWQIETVDSDELVGSYTSLALDSSNRPHISYYYAYNCDLKFATTRPDWDVDDIELRAGAEDDGVLLSWSVTGDSPSSVRVLRSLDDNEPEDVSGALPGSAERWLDTEVEPGVEYRYWLEVIEEDGTVSRFGPVEATWPGPDSDRLTLYAPYPCPVTDRVTLSFYLPEDTRNVELSLYDLSGRLVASSVSIPTTTGRHEITYDTSDLLPGVYITSLTTDTGTLTRRLVISR